MTTQVKTNTDALHTKRTERHPVGADRVYGYQMVERYSDNPLGYAARLYAVEKNGKVWTRTTNDPDRFFENGTVWEAAGYSANMVAQKSDYVGVYEASEVSKH